MKYEFVGTYLEIRGKNIPEGANQVLKPRLRWSVALPEPPW
jgi:hypothetical protein